MPTTQRRSDWLLFSLCATVTFAALGWLLGAGLFDDTYIYFRYADNIVGGAGAVFNSGERVEGFTSPFWMMLLVAIRLVTHRLELAALLLSAAAAVCTALLVHDTVSRQPRGGVPANRTPLLALGLLALPAMVYNGFSGMEESFFALVVTAVLVSALADDRRGVVSARTAALLVIAVLTRPEGLLLAGWIGAFFTVRHARLDAQWCRSIAAPIALSLGTFGLLLAARYAYYGSLVPNTYFAKITPGVADRLWNGVWYVGRCLGVHAPLLILAGLLYRLATRHAAVPRQSVAVLVGWLVLWSCYVAAVGGDHFAMFRFFLPALPAVVLLIGILWQAVQPHLGRAWRRAFPALLAAAFVICSAASTRVDGRARGEKDLAKMWRTTGQWIAANTPPNTLVATNVIGAIGYFSQRRIVDMAGLVDPVVARDGTIRRGADPGHARYYTDYVFKRAPDIVVYWTSGAKDKPAFTQFDALADRWHFSLIDFLLDPRCPKLYEHVAAPLPNGSWIEMQKKRTFQLPAGYQVAPDS